MSEWLWYFSQDEERWNGGCVSRQEAIDEGIRAYGGDPFMVCRARLAPIRFAPSGWRILEMLDDLNEEALDPEGDGLFGPVTKGQEAHLSCVVAAAIEGWARYWNNTPASWSFAETRDEETVLAGDAYDDARRRDYHLRVADMGFFTLYDWQWRKLHELYPLTKGVVGRPEVP